MKVTHKQRLLIQKYLNHYYQLHSECEGFPFKTQMQLLYDYVTHLEE